MRSKFTSVEDEELVTSIQNNPGNLQKTFRELAAKWGTHTPESISDFYYRKVKNQHFCFATVGKTKVTTNTKIVKDIIPDFKETNLWVKIKKLFKKCFKDA